MAFFVPFFFFCAARFCRAGGRLPGRWGWRSPARAGPGAGAGAALTDTAVWGRSREGGERQGQPRAEHFISLRVTHNKLCRALEEPSVPNTHLRIEMDFVWSILKWFEWLPFTSNESGLGAAEKLDLDFLSHLSEKQLFILKTSISPILFFL